MEKSTKHSVAVGMSSTDAGAALNLVQSILGLKTLVKEGSAAPEILERIGNLRGILELRADWRRGPSATSGVAATQPIEPRWRRTTHHSAPSNNHQAPPPPTGKYQSRFKNSSEPLEEKILNRIIRLKLNKFGQPTYNEIRDFLFQILGQESEHIASEGQVSEFVCDFMRMVFRKAAAEEMYCPLYAKLLAEIGYKHSCIFDEMNRLYDNYMEIFEEDQIQKAAEGDLEQKLVENKYRLGYSQFIAELTALEILSLDSLALLWGKLLVLLDKAGRSEDKKALVDEYVDCLLRMSRVMKEKHTAFFASVRQRLWRDNKERLVELINRRDGTYGGLSPKSRFLLMDVQDILMVA